jgi:hypothetical protein
VLKKVDPVSEPKSSATTSDSDSLTILIDTLLAPSAESEDFVGDWIYVRSQPIAVDSTANINEGGQFSTTDTTLTVTSSTPFTVGDGIQFSATGTATGEICRVVTITDGTTIEIVRGIQGTTATTHEDSDNIFIIGPAIGEIARVTAVDFSGSNSKLTVAPGFSASLISGADYERHRKVRPNILNDRLDVILGLLRQNVTLPVTIAGDGDFEKTTVVAGDWTAVQSTLTKDTTIVRHGRHSLKIEATSTPGQATSSFINLPGGTKVIIAADVYITSGDSAKLSFIDVSNSDAVIGTAMESDETGWVHLENLFTVPTTSERVAVWLESQTNGDITYWDHVTVWPVLDKGIDLPSHLEFLFDVNSLFFYPVGTGLAGSTNVDAYRINEGAPQFYAHSQKELDDTGVGASRFYIPTRKPTNALWIKGRKPYDAFSGSTEGIKDFDTTQANRYVVANMTAASILDDLALDAIEAEKFELARKLTERALLLRFEINHIMANMTPPNKLITTPFTRKRV